MNVSYINPFILATEETFRTMLKSEAKPGKPSLKSTPSPSYDVSGIIGLSGDAIGAIVLSFPRIVALKVVSALLGTEIKIVGPEVSDGIGELANIVAGSAKQYMKGLHVTISLPNVVIGKGHTVVTLQNATAFVVPFTSASGPFAMEVALKTK